MNPIKRSNDLLAQILPFDQDDSSLTVHAVTEARTTINCQRTTP